MHRQSHADLPQCWQIISAMVRARDGPGRVDQVYRLLLLPKDGRLIGRYARLAYRLWPLARTVRKE